MSSSPRETSKPDGDDSQQLTMQIKTLSMPAAAGDDAFEEQLGAALLLVRDATSQKWGRRWLAQSGLNASVPTDLSNALRIASAERPDVIVVESSLPGASGGPLYADLLDSDEIDSPIIVLCSNSREVSTALDAGADDVACKPLEWQAIAKRARNAWDMKAQQRSLDARSKSLQEALKLADRARRTLRSQEALEPVTGLPNRTKFVELLRRGMRSVDRDKNALGVFVIGFTRFRLVVEAMGQEQADSILAEIGRNLVECLQNSGTEEIKNQGLRTAAAASLDQFRFALMLTYSGDNDEVAILQQQLQAALSRPIQVSGQMVHLSACLGIAAYPQDADDVDSLLQRADNAMRDAQSRGGGFKYYSAETDAAAARKLKIEHMLHEALDREELTLNYQPINDVASGKIVAVEALLRWQQADGTAISPEEFIAVAEESGLIIRTGEFVLENACRQFAEWRATGVMLPVICVNAAKAQLASAGFAQSVRRILDKHEIDPSNLELEISERGVLSGDYDVIGQLQELKNLGVKLSIDDFGTGNSAIAYLKDLPVDTLKIDRSYIAGLTDNGKDAAIASAMIALGQRLNLTVIAEGIESQGQLDILRELGCDAYQGFLETEPLAAEAFAAHWKR